MGVEFSAPILQHSNTPFFIFPYTFTSRVAPGIQICSGRGSPVASIARSTMSRIWVNHQLARAMRPSRRVAFGRGRMPVNPSSSWLSVAFVILNLSLRDIFAEGVGQTLSKQKNFRDVSLHKPKNP